MRIAWFSPMPPSRSGIAAYSAEVLPLLRRHHEIDVFAEPDAHDFVWKQRRNAYDLTVFQLGNAQCHGYMWAYLFKYPGMVVLHDAQLHQARALWLLTERVLPRRDDYRAEFRANHPDAPADAAELIVAGLGQGSLYQRWPFVRLVLERARLTLVHNRRLRDALAEQHPFAAIDAVEMGVEEPHPTLSRRDILARHGIPAESVVIAALGGVTPEKRLGPLMQAMRAVADRTPRIDLIIVGEPADHYDATADAARHGVADRVHCTGFVADAEVASYVAAADICSCLRWPTNRETSASWLRCLAAGKPTLITALSQLIDLPPIAATIDVLDEERALADALALLANDQPYRTRMGAEARAWWEAHHRIEQMADAYLKAIVRATSLPIPEPRLPDHFLDRGDRVLRELAAEMGVGHEVSDLLD